MKFTHIWPPSRRAPVPVGVLGFLCLVPSLFLFGAGVRAWLTSHAYPIPRTLTYTQFVSRKPISGWYTITGAFMDVKKSVYWEQNGVCISVFAPLIPNSGYYVAGPDIYVELSDPKTLSAFLDSGHTHVRAVGRSAVNDLLRNMKTYSYKGAPPRFSGLVSFGHRDPIGRLGQ